MSANPPQFLVTDENRLEMVLHDERQSGCRFTRLKLMARRFCTALLTIGICLTSKSQTVSVGLTVQASFSDRFGDTFALADQDNAGGLAHDLATTSLAASVSGSFVGHPSLNPNPDTVVGTHDAELVWVDQPSNGFKANGTITSFISHSNDRGSNLASNRVFTNHRASSELFMTIEDIAVDQPFSLHYESQRTSSDSSANIQLFGRTTLFSLPAIPAIGGTAGTVSGILKAGENYTLRAQSFSAIQPNLRNIDSSASWGFSLLLGAGANANASIGPSGSLPASNLQPDLASVFTSSNVGDGFQIPEFVEPFFFDNAATGRWYGSPAASGFVYQMEDGALFTEIIDFADGFEAPFEVWAHGQSLGTFRPNDNVDFVSLLGQGVSRFAVTGIRPLVEGDEPFTFPIQLAFDTETADFTQWTLASRLAGDVNGNGSVEQGDLDLVLGNWGQPRGDWANADGFTSGGVDQEELDAVLGNWGVSASPRLTSNPAVPEPWVAVGLGFGLLGLRFRGGGFGGGMAHFAVRSDAGSHRESATT